MTGRRAIVGLCMLCALVFSAFAAQSAAAATNGTTAFTCAKASEIPGKVGTKGFKDAECKIATENKTGELSNVQFEHIEFATATKITGKGGLTKLHSVISGVEVELQSTSLTGTGTMENMLKAAEPLKGEHTANGTGIIKYAGVTVTKPAGKGCVVTGGAVETKELKATTSEQAMGLKFEPASGTLFAEFNVTGCTIAALNGKYEVKGSVVGEPVGTGTVTTAAGTTAQGTLTLRGQKAGIDGTLNILGESGTPLAATTVETP